MNKNFLIIFILLIVNCINGFSQDLIIKTNNDSINCAIIRITNKNFYYNLGKDTTNYKIAISDVKEYKYNYYRNENNIRIAKKALNEISTEKEGHNYDYLSISLFAGKEFMAKANNNMLMTNIDSVASYKKTLNSGYFFGGDIAYYMNDYIGLGVRFDYYFTSVQTNKFEYSYFVLNKDSVWVTELRSGGYFSDNIGMAFAEFFISGKYNLKRGYFYGNIGITMLKFKNTHFEIYQEYLRKGTVIGFGVDLGYEIKIIKNLAVGLKLSYSAAKLKELSVNGNSKSLRETDYINLGRYGASVSVKFWLQQFKIRKLPKKQ